MTQGSAEVIVSRLETPSHATTRGRFYWCMSILLLLFVFVGFARTFFLGPFFDGRPIQPYVYVHGAIMTGWYVMFVAQTSLVAAHRTDLHRRLGVVTVIVGIAVALMSAFVTLEFPVNIGERRTLTPDSNVLSSSLIFWGDLANVIAFSTFLGAAVLYRRHSGIHKRLMLLASISMISEAVLRVGWLLPLGGTQPGQFATATVFLLIFAMMAHDYSVDRRIHPVSLIGGLSFFLVGRLFVRSVVGGSEFGRTVVLNLAGVSS